MEAKNTKLEQAREFPRPPSVRYGVALLLTGLAAAFDFLIPELGSQVPFFSFYLSTSVAAWFGGLRAGLLSTAAALAIVDHYFISPNGFAIRRSGLLSLLVAWVIMGTIALLTGNRSRTPQVVAIE